MKLKFIQPYAQHLLTEDVLTIINNLNNHLIADNDFLVRGHSGNTKFRYYCGRFEGYRSKDIIIKLGGGCKSIRKFHLADKYYPIFAVPTVVVKTDCGYPIRIQPKVDTSDRSKNRVFKYMSSMRKKEILKYFGADSHDENIGILHGSPVVFDW